jgi:hypothetical protein
MLSFDIILLYIASASIDTRTPICAYPANRVAPLPRAPGMNNLETTKEKGAPSTLLRYRTKDTSNGVTKETALRLAEHYGVNETQLLHQLLAEAATRELPQYEPDDGPLSAEAWKAVERRAPKKRGRVLASLID